MKDGQYASLYRHAETTKPQHFVPMAQVLIVRNRNIFSFSGSINKAVDYLLVSELQECATAWIDRAQPRSIQCWTSPATLGPPLTEERSARFSGFCHYWLKYLYSQKKPWDEGWSMCLIVSARRGHEATTLCSNGSGFDYKE
jgi:hypothetical protein